MENIFYLIIAFSFCVKAQTEGIVKDSLTGLPTEFATIWIENENIGTTTEKDGTFSINVSLSKIIIVLVLDYGTKKLNFADRTNIILQPAVYEINEVVIVPRKNKNKIEIGRFKKSKIQQWSGSGLNPIIYAKFIKSNPEIRKHQ